ncbi:MAG: sulfotransferase family protein [Acidiferrobacterales bacterium]|nr:sulfotransferase family protein [Acidiferrobacterales bacterium]
MEAVVNDQYRYIMFYSPKSGCSSMRKLFLALHLEELSEEQKSELVDFHNLSVIFPYKMDRDYSDYYKFTVSRNPYSRIVSAYFDQYVYQKNSGIEGMYERVSPKNGEPTNFIEFLEYLATVPDRFRDSHFKTQSYFHYEHFHKSKLALDNRNKTINSLHLSGDLQDFNKIVLQAYGVIFKEHNDMYERAKKEIENIPRVNSQLYSDEVSENVANLTVAELNEMAYAPLPQYFFESARAKKLTEKIYRRDFKNFNYLLGDVPQKKPSTELKYIPKDFDWQSYLALNPDLKNHDLTSQRLVTRHFLIHGRHEENRRYYKIEAPEGFDWRKYLELREDLVAAGITSEKEAIAHYLTYGRNEGSFLNL